ncbi:MAG: hypothetical protein JXK93_01025 [Sphaerochaetaceae bacterium]|nr:hypothetical protein [Sphaerochaetaceae bacterium]
MVSLSEEMGTLYLRAVPGADPIELSVRREPVHECREVSFIRSMAN